MKLMKLKLKRAYYCAPIIAAAYSGHAALAANTPDYFGQSISNATALDTNTNWSTQAFPVSTNDAVINTTYMGHTGSSTTFTTSSNLNFGSLDFNYSNGYFAYIKGTSSTGSYLLTLGGTANSNVDAPNNNDLIYYGSSPELQIASNTSSGTINIALAQTGNIDVATSPSVLRIDGAISGAYQLTKTGPGTLFLANTAGGTFGNAGVANSNVTPFTLDGGILELYSGTDLGTAPASTAQAPDLIFAANSTLQTAYTSSTSNFGNTRNFQINSGVVATIDSSTATFNISGGINGSGGLMKIGTGILLLNGVSNYSGGTNLNAGTILMNTSSGLANAPLNISGGTLSILANHTTSQSFSAVNLLPGSAAFSVASFTSGSSSLALGAFNHTTGNTTDFTLPTTGGITTTVANASFAGGSPTIIGGYATANGQTTWAVSQSTGGTPGAITPLATFDNSFTSPGADVDVTTASANTAPTTVVNSLRFNTANAITVTPSTSLTIATGGILNTINVGANTNNISGGTITATSGELSVIQADTSAPFVLASALVDSATTVALTKSGAGTLDLVGSNSFSGPTNIDAGYLVLMNQFALLNTTINVQNNVSSGTTGVSSLVFDSSVTANAFTIGNLNSSGGVTLANNAATPVPIVLTVGNNANASYGGVLSGAGELVKVGTGTLFLSSGANTNSGGILVTAGLLRFGEGGDLGSAADLVTVNNSGGVAYLSNGASFFGAARGFILNGGNDTIEVGALTSTNGSTSVLTIGQAGNASSGTLSTPGSATTPATLVKTGLGTLNIEIGSTYNGGTNVSEGTLVAVAATSLGTSSISGVSGPLLLSPASTFSATVNIQSPTAAVSSLTNYVAGIAAAGTSSVVLGSSTGPTAFSVGADNTSTTYSGSISDFNTSAGEIGTVIKTGAGTLTLSGNNTFTGGTNVSAGTLAIASATGLPAASNLIIGTSATVFAANSGTGTYALSLNTLTNSGLLDLGKNAAVIHMGTTTTTLFNEIAATFANGAWTGTTGITSSAAEADSTHLTAVGFLANDNGSGSPLYGTNGGIASTFEGVTPVDNDLLIKYTYYGDANLDGKVDGSDYSRIDSGFVNHLSGWYNGDFNYDGMINGSDYTLIDNAFNTQGTPLAAEIASPLATATAEIAGTSAVPEPATLSLVAFATVGLLGSRRRRGSTRLARAK